MWFEAKHKYFKHVANVIGNFNICYSLALCHQLHQCYLSIDLNVLPGEENCKWTRFKHIHVLHIVCCSPCIVMVQAILHLLGQVSNCVVYNSSISLLLPRFTTCKSFKGAMAFNCTILSHKFVQVCTLHYYWHVLVFFESS